ncbi:hypothetical protein BaRGS_00036663 [Batillaria attramentaria]|uniref:Uncharacterized protein n=1 Tax=Batillaria attramentaria TaxID=370345 RepID=A0ABD0JAV4_9CAEN
MEWIWHRATAQELQRDKDKLDLCPNQAVSYRRRSIEWIIELQHKNYRGTMTSPICVLTKLTTTEDGALSGS